MDIPKNVAHTVTSSRSRTQIASIVSRRKPGFRKSHTSSSHIDSPRLSIHDGIDRAQFDVGAIDGSDSNTGTAEDDARDHNYSLVLSLFKVPGSGVSA